ncbi:Neisseria PilC beta-propeller domain protein [compost metagenome]
MKKIVRWIDLALLSLLFIAGSAAAEDIDLFVGSAGTDSSLPNVIFVLDNTSNWSRQAQKWPGGLTQGQSEVRAINNTLPNLVDKVNVGLIEYTTQGNANQDGGYVRFNLQKLTEESKTQLSNTLTTIFNNIESPTEKRNSNTPYGDLMYDVYNYLAGLQQSDAGEGTPSVADSNAYTTAYSHFKSPLTTSNLCTNTYLIFIGNPDQSGPTTDTSSNTLALKVLYEAVGGTPDGLAGTSTPAPLPIPGFSVTTVTEPSTSLGFSAQCYKDSEVDSCTVAETLTGGLCADKTECACSTSSKSSNTTGCVTNGNPADRTARLAVIQGGGTTTTVTPNGTSNLTSGRAWNFDDWAKFLSDYGVPVGEPGENGQRQRVSVTTYTIDVFNKQQNSDQTGLMLSASEGVGGGRYFAAKNEDEISGAINSIMSDIISVSSTFAAVTLPLSATNRAQQENQVYIGMFRPDKQAAPRWFGNLKRYQIVLFNGIPQLADASRNVAINTNTDFATECAKSFWTTDSGDYWSGLGITPPPRSQCLEAGNTNSVWSDLPDGPFVEKGGVAQVTRNSNLDTRNILTVQPGTATTADSLTAMDEADAIGGETVLDYLFGKAVGVDETADSQGVRPSLHGDVIHSRPLTINYGDSNGVYVYYGANDGLLRSVRATDGAEEWSFIAPEHYDKIKRLYDNSPVIAFPNQDFTATPAPEPKGYFFDGSIGQLVRYNAESQVDLAYIFPTMRRGGRMVYGFNVTDPTEPELLWRFGCPSLTSDGSCIGGSEEIGQTWSAPQGGYLAGYVTETGEMKPVVMFGGGYDNCLDSDVANYPCSSSAKGKRIFVLDAETGTSLGDAAKLSTDAPIVADLATVDIDFNGSIEFAYAADADGGLWRVNFATVDANGNVTSLAPANWSVTKIANTLDQTRRFLNQPSVAVVKNSVYVAIGSGNRERPLASNYPYVSSVQDRFYTFVDFPAVATTTPVDLDGNLLGDVTQVTGTTGGTCTGKGQRGWYINLTGRGEQVVNPAAIAAGKVLFNTYRPSVENANACSLRLGAATGYQMSLFNPTSCDVDRTTDIKGGGMPIPPIITVVPVTDKDGNNGKTVTVCIGCEGLPPIEVEPDTDQSRRRVYWKSDVDR